MKWRIGKKIKKDSVLYAKCRYCGKIYVGPGIYEIPDNVSWQIITCRDCQDKLPKDDYYGKIMRKH